MIDELRKTYDLLPGRAACDLMEEWGSVAGWLSKFYVPANPDPEIADSHYAYLKTEEASAALQNGEYYLSGGESVIANVVVSLLDSDHKVDLQELWRLGAQSRATIYKAIEGNAR